MFKELTNWLLIPINNLFKWLNDFVAWVYDFITNFPAFVLDWVADGIVSFFVHLPVPSFFSTASSIWASIPSEVAFFMGLCQFNFGIALVLSAYLLRFILRRIPLIG